MKFKIRDAREAAGFSQKELAKVIGVAPSTFNGYESGNHDPKSDLLLKIAEACNVTVDFLLGREETTPADQKNAPSADKSVPGEKQLINLYRELNEEGQEKLVDYADDLVVSGKYIKSDKGKLGTEKQA
ncbi:MAG: helix-turn-helix transcriptional regulator [Oscillibacter sp.]|nr:helix-turn-helix transcriptional regulator [Oscillibacter sp.]